MVTIAPILAWSPLFVDLMCFPVYSQHSKAGSDLGEGVGDGGWREAGTLGPRILQAGEWPEGTQPGAPSPPPPAQREGRRRRLTGDSHLSPW